LAIPGGNGKKISDPVRTEDPPISEPFASE
jgi:hypothetical protein